MKSQPRLRKWIVSGVAVLALAPVVPALMLAQAHSFEANSAVGIAYNANTRNFHGFVHSPRPSCLEDRTVWLMKKVGGAFTQLEPDRSGPQGGWSVHRTHPDGTFRARVTLSEGGGYGHSHVCLPDNSKSISI